MINKKCKKICCLPNGYKANDLYDWMCDVNCRLCNPLTPAVDNVNHPPHYTSSKAECSGCEKPIECIDVTRHMNFNIGNAVKYLWRYELKGGTEDLKKAIWYINDEINK